MYFYRDPKAKLERLEHGNLGIAIELKLVNRIRERVAAWRMQGYPGVTRSRRNDADRRITGRSIF